MVGKHQDERHKEQPLARRSKDVGTDGHATRLRNHVGWNDDGTEDDRQQLIAQGSSTHVHHVNVVAKEGDDLAAKERKQHGHAHEEHGTHLHTEPKAALHPVIKSGTIAETAHGLIALSQANHHAEDEHREAIDDAHACNGGIAKTTCAHIQRDSGEAGQPLSEQRGRASGNNLAHQTPTKRHISPMIMNDMRMQTHAIHHQKAYHLSGH